MNAFEVMPGKLFSTNSLKTTEVDRETRLEMVFDEDLIIFYICSIHKMTHDNPNSFNGKQHIH